MNFEDSGFGGPSKHCLNVWNFDMVQGVYLLFCPSRSPIEGTRIANVPSWKCEFVVLHFLCFFFCCLVWLTAVQWRPCLGTGRWHHQTPNFLFFGCSLCAFSGILFLRTSPKGTKVLNPKHLPENWAAFPRPAKHQNQRKKQKLRTIRRMLPCFHHFSSAEAPTAWKKKSSQTSPWTCRRAGTGGWSTENPWWL